jgi:hypothetical protein
MSDEAPAGRSMWERHVQTVVSIIIAGVVAWVGKTVQDQSVQIAEMRVEIRSLQTLATGQYTAARASADLAVRDAQIADLRDRIRVLESERRNHP